MAENILDTLLGASRATTEPSDNTPTDKDIGATNLEHFAKTYFPHIFSTPFCDFHHSMFKDAENMILHFDNLQNKVQYHVFCIFKHRMMKSQNGVENIWGK